MRQLIVSFSLAALLAASAAGQDAIAIKVSYPKAGQRAKVTIEDKTTAKTSFNIGGKDQSKNEVKSKSFVYVDEIIENPKNEKRAAKLKRTYEKAAINTDGKAATLAVEGKTVLIEKKGEKYSFTIDGKAVEGDAFKLLDEEFNKPEQNDLRDAMFPSKPVKPGETWKIDPADLVKAIGEKGPTFAKEKITASGKLVKAYQKDGRQFGVIEFEFDAPITGLGEKSPLTISDGKMSMKLTGDGCIDGTIATGKSTSKITLSFTGTTMGVEVKASVEGVENRTMEMLTK